MYRRSLRTTALAGAALALAAPLLGLTLTASPAHAATTEHVSEPDVTRQAENSPPTDDWVLYTRAGTPASAGQFRLGPGNPPLGAGSLQLQTVSGNEKVFLFNYDHVGTRLADVDDIAYSTFRIAGNQQQVTALNLQVDPDGPDVPGGFTTLVFEPVYNTDQGAVVTGAWQDWTATGSGVWWSTRPIPGTGCAGATAACDQTWDEIVANNPDATILGGVGVNQGSGNDSLTAAVDGFTFDETTYDLGPTAEDCKGGGYRSFSDPAFRNQGQCVSYFQSNSPRR